jgi:hypothetical protein
MNTRPRPHWSSRLAATVASAAAVVAFVAGCVTAPGQARVDDDGVRFADDWQAHTKPLIFHGIGPNADRTLWMVPATLPKGSYRVITRDAAGVPHLVDGQRFTVTSDVFREVNLVMDNFVHAPEAIDERFVVLPGPPPAPR